MDKEALTKNESQPEPLSSLKMSSLEEEDEEFARAIRNMKLSPRPSCVPAEVESQSLVSSSSDSHSRKSIGFKADMMRSKSGCRRTNRGILDGNQRRTRNAVVQWSRSRIERNDSVERERKEGEKRVRKTALGPVVVYFEMFGEAAEAAPGFVPATAGALGGRRGAVVRASPTGGAEPQASPVSRLRSFSGFHLHLGIHTHTEAPPIPLSIIEMASHADFKDRQFLAVIGDEVSIAP